MNSITNLTALTEATVQRRPMHSARKTSLAAGIFYIITFISIPTLSLYGPVHQPGYISGSGNDHQVIIGGILEVIVALAGIATAIILYPVFRKQNESLALGLVAARVLEAATIFVGVAFLLSIVTLHTNAAGASGEGVSHSLVILYDRIFSLGQGFIPAIDDLLLGILLYKSRLVPRALSIMGIAGALPLIAGFLAIMFGWMDRISPWSVLSALPVAVFEFSLGIYLIVKGFRVSSVDALENKSYFSNQ